MLESILAVLHNATTLLFGVYISAAFLGVRMNRHNVFTLLIFSGAVGIIYIAAYLDLGTEGTEKIYPLIIHLPLVLFLSRYYKYKPALSALSVLTAYLCCQISKWVGLVAYAAMPQMWIYYAVTHHRHSHHLHYPYTVCLRCYRAAVAKAHSVPPHLGPNATSLLCV